MKPKWAIAAWIMVALFVVAVPLSFWWANTVPSRPDSVAQAAVFLWAPHVGLPAPRRGWWLVCSQNQTRNQCRLSSKSGVTEFERDFVPFHRRGPIAGPDLVIDARRTESAQKFFIGDALVPLVYLENGVILIPLAKLKEGTNAIRQMQHVNR